MTFMNILAAYYATCFITGLVVGIVCSIAGVRLVFQG